MTRVLAPIRRHPLIAYVVLAWGLSWAYWIPMALRGEVVTPGGNVSHFPGLLGPLVAAVIVTAIAEGRAGLRDFGGRLVRWRVPLRWYLVAALPYVIFLGAVALQAVTGGATPTLADMVKFSGLPVLAFPLVVLLVLIFNGYGEEAGWRGFLTPHLLARRGPLTTSLIVAAVWFTWHVPSFWVIETYRNMGLAIIPMMGFGILSGAIVLTWLYIGSGGSIWIIALWHVALNFGSATIAGRGMAGIVVYNAMLLWAIVVVIGWLLATEPKNRSFLTRLRDGFMIATLRSPLGRFFGGMTVITFRTRRSGRTLMTPVECVYEPGHLFVLVGHPEQKQWWRNVRANPEVTVAIGGREVTAHATVHVGDDPQAEDDLATYLEHRPRVARALGLPPERTPDRAGLAAAAEKTVSVRIDLRPAPAG
jgi:deazaflavin-dependent oxidoreductase (nitroreductase family)